LKAALRGGKSVNWLLEESKLFQEKLPTTIENMSLIELEQRVREIKDKLGEKLLILGHHYQKDEVIKFSDAVGDSLQLAQYAEKNDTANHIVFCGVHFMAETADILTNDDQHVILPDLRAGCSMADMATYEQTIKAWKVLTEKYGNDIIPVTYVNSTAEIKAFVGEKNGTTVTSSNAEKIVEWALNQGKIIFFLPDQHLGRNTAHKLGVDLAEMAIWNPITEELEIENNTQDIKVVLWKGHCSVHENFTVENINSIRSIHKDINVIVHPECTFEVVQASDYNGSTKYIVDVINAAEKGTKWAIGTEHNLVNRLINDNMDKQVYSLNPYMCSCLTMNRIDLKHLVWSLENILKKDVKNIIKVDQQVAVNAKKALNKMMNL
jgi:quinolinate synthase